MNPLLISGLFATGLLAPAFAQDAALPPPDFTPAQPPGMLSGGATHGTEEFRLRYYRSDDALANFEDLHIFDYMEAVQRLDVQGGSASWTMALQGDAVGLFLNEYRLDDVLHHERDLYQPSLSGPTPELWFNLEKVSLSNRGAAGSVELGDSYTAFGRGMALNLVNNGDIDVDTSVRGVKGLIRAGNAEITVLSGQTNPQQMRLENPNIDLRADYPHTVNALRAELYGPVHVGAHGVLWQFAREPATTGDWLATYGQTPDAGILGATVDASSVGPFDLGAEADVYVYGAEEIIASVPSKLGWSAYGSATAYPGIASVLVELRASKDAEWINTFAGPDGYEVATGPSLEYERVITEDSSASVNSNDIVGGRIRTDIAAINGADTSLSLYASVAGFRDSDTGGLHFNETPENIVHGLLGATWVHGDFHLLANAGARTDLRDDAPSGNPGDRMAHADVSLTVPIAGPVSVELAPSILAYHWGQNPVPQADYVDVSNALAVKVGGQWAFILYNDYSDNPLVDSTGNLTEDLYAAGEVQWMPTSATTLKLFYGAYRAGIKCAGGQCRQLPGFEGGRVSVTANF